MGVGVGQVVNELTFYSDDPSLIPAKVYNSFCVKNCLKKNVRFEKNKYANVQKSKFNVCNHDVKFLSLI